MIVKQVNKNDLITEKLGDICEQITDGTHDSPKLLDSGVPFIKGKQIKDGVILFENADYISTEDHLEAIKRAHPQQGDVLFTNIGTVGVTAMVKGNVDFSIKNVALLRADKNKIYDRYLYYLLKSPQVQNSVKGITSGAAQPFIALDFLRSHPIRYIKNIKLQKVVASNIGYYDDLIANNNRRIKILEEMTQTIYDEWFVKFHFPGHTKVKMVDSELGEIPDGWKIDRLCNLVTTQYGYTESASAKKLGPKYLRGKDINKTSYVNWDTVPYCPIKDEDYKKYKLDIGDIVVIRMADPGKAAIVEKDIDAVFASYLIRLGIKASNLTPYYLYYFLISNIYQSYIQGACTGTTRKSASAGVVTGINMVVPPKLITKSFEETVEPIRGLINTLLSKNSSLTKTRDLLLPKLISGQIDVENIDIKGQEE